MRFLTVNNSVAHIDLWGNGIGAAGVQAIADAVETNPFTFTPITRTQKLALVTVRNTKRVSVLYKTPVNVIRRIMTHYRVNLSKRIWNGYEIDIEN